MKAQGLLYSNTHLLVDQANLLVKHESSIRVLLYNNIHYLVDSSLILLIS